VLHNTGWAVIEVGSKGRGEDHCNVYRINPEKRTPSVLLKRPKKRTRGAILERAEKSNLLRLKSHFLRQKAHPAREEPLNHSNHKKERGAQAHAAQSARVERGNVTESETTSVDAPLNPALTTSADAPVPEPVDGPVPRAEARTEPITEQQPKPTRDNPIGTPVKVANADGDADRAAVFERGRKVLGAGSDALVARLLDAERALDALDDADRALDALNAAANEDDPHAHIENEIALSLHLAAHQ
jgi:hypothetical protein